VVQRRIENELARRILSGDVADGQCVTVDFVDGDFQFSAQENAEPAAADVAA
jgi:hypothetical protein